MPNTTPVHDQIRLELRRGTLTLAVLSALRQEQYGYTLRKTLADAGLAIEESALYPMLRRLEDQGLLASKWRTEGGRDKRFYRLSAAGVALLPRILDDWHELTRTLDGLFAGD